MNYKKSSIQIIKEVVDSMQFPVTINTTVDNGDGTIDLLCCDIYHAQAGFNVTIDNVSCLITAIDADAKIITIRSGSPITATSFDLYRPYFFFGTPIEEGAEFEKRIDASDHTPMIWLCVDGSFKDKFYRDPSFPIEREITADIFFLTQADTDNWISEDAFREAIEPMNRLQEHFEKVLHENPSVFNIIDTDFTRSYYQKFGVWLKGSGTKNNLWTDKLAGCSIGLGGLKVFKQQKCDVCEGLPSIPDEIIESTFIVQ